MKLYTKKDLQESRIFFDQKPPCFLTLFVFFVLALLTGVVIVSATLTKNYIVEAQGVITTSDNVYIGALSDGVVVELKKMEGEKVKQGDILFTVSSGVEGVQYNGILMRIEELKRREGDLGLFVQSLEADKNLLENGGSQQEYYAKMEYYLSIKKDEKESLAFQNKEKGKRIEKRAKLETEIRVLEEQIQVLEGQVGQVGQVANEPVNQPTEALPESNTEVPETNIEKPEPNLENPIPNMERKGELDMKIKELEAIQTEIDQSEQIQKSQTEQTKLQFLSEAGAAKTSLQTNLTEFEGQLSTYKTQDNLYQVSASKDGYVHYLNPMKQGMAVQRTQTIAEISENFRDSMMIEAYIQAYDISKVKQKAPVKVAINGVNIQKYGTLPGRLIHIDTGTVSQETKEGNVLLYRCIVEIDKKELNASSGEAIEAIKSMPVVARIVYDQETYLDWVLEMLRFKQ